MGGLLTDLAIEQSLMRTVKSREGLTRGRGMTQSIRLLWVLSGHKCSEVHEAMGELSRSERATSETILNRVPYEKVEILLNFWKLFSGY